MRIIAPENPRLPIHLFKEMGTDKGEAVIFKTIKTQSGGFVELNREAKSHGGYIAVPGRERFPVPA